MAPSHTTMSSGSVVFSLLHIRSAIFSYHADEIRKEREALLGAISRPINPGFWDSVAQQHNRISATAYFAKKVEGLAHTNLLALLDVLGLKLARYVDFLAARAQDCHFWVSAVSALGGSRKWEGWGRGDQRLEAAPRDGQDNGVHEEPDSNPAEMLVCSSVNYRTGVIEYQRDHWTEAEGLAHLLRDKVGRIFVLQLLDPTSQPFIFEAAAKRPEVLFSVESPFYPTHQVVEYSSQLGAVVWQCPPHTLSYYLAPGTSPPRDELRRILERAHDAFANLAILEEWGLSLNHYVSDHWVRWMSTGTGKGGYWLPAYLEHNMTAHYPGKLERYGVYEERLPSPPATAWPMAPTWGPGGIAGLPWSQITAYNDPRVAGPRLYLYGVTHANWSDADVKKLSTKLQLKPNQHPLTRFHDDLLNVTLDLLKRFFPDHKTDIYTLLLTSASTSDLYEQTLRTEVDIKPRDCRTGHSGLFTFCANCVHKLKPMDDTRGFDEFDTLTSKCPKCRRYYEVNSMPDAVRRLLLRIVQPETRPDGSLVIVTAKEAADVMKSVLATELPRLERHYNLWCDGQKQVARMATAGPLPLKDIQKDVSSHRWSMLEMLRGNLLDGRYRRADQIKLRDTMKAFHAERAKQDEERAARKARAGGPTGDAKDSTSTEADEAGVSALLPAAAPEGAKRPAKGGSGGAKTAKKSKAG